MQTYEMITENDLKHLSKESLVNMYNDAVETIWLLRERIEELSEENDSVWEAYEEVSNQLYG